MLRRTVTVVDDLDGTSPADTVHFALDGVRYEIDLSAPNAQELAAIFAPYAAAARRQPGQVRRRRR